MKDKYLVAIRTPQRVDIIGFPTRKQALAFTKDLDKDFPHIEYAIGVQKCKKSPKKTSRKK